jgi:Tfp pilus assembly protein PilO
MTRTTLVLIVGAVVVFTGLWWVFVVGGVDNRIEDADLRAQDLELQRASVERQLLRLQEAGESRRAYRQALDAIEQSIPAEPDMAGFIEDLNDLADRNGVDIVAIGSSEPRPFVGDPPTDVLVIDLDLALEAQFFEMLGFLFALEDFERLVVIDSISVNPGGGESLDSPTFEQDVLTVNMTSRIFATRSPVLAGGGDGGA